MEEARVARLKQSGLTFADWLKAGVDLPVVDLSLKYQRSLTLGDEALVKACLAPKTGVRIDLALRYSKPDQWRDPVSWAR